MEKNKSKITKEQLLAEVFVRDILINHNNMNPKELSKRLSLTGLALIVKYIHGKNLTRQAGTKIIRKMIPEKLNLIQIINLIEKNKKMSKEETKSFAKKMLMKKIPEGIRKEKIVNYLIGKVMEVTDGRADPLITREVLSEGISNTD